MRNHNHVIRGDLIFSIGNSETWGPLARADPLSDFFMNSLGSHNLIAVNLIKLRPTWRNHRTGEARIPKSLDRFILCEDLASRIPAFHQWVGEGGNSNQFPILLELSKPPLKSITPFKFNPTWLQEDSFNKPFKETWRTPSRDSIEDKSFLFIENLKRLKKATIEWAKAMKQK